ncbi:hypothetical protein [Sinomonas sp. ASV322]|uniref:phage tail protein n=1 Tax=Sinomonas sp. ASV322 TaxID=3041920 RepID=UPI0027DE480F|nr:hypothetical protein [Sinomonas sp. ASV322]MDQ4502186.1 hypothetical protein [Sinomonas sp. ASV322]
MSEEVGSGHVAIFPKFTGFRRAVSAEVAGSGRESGSAFSKAFSASADGAAQAVSRNLQSAVASASQALSKARLSEADASGKVRVAEARLLELRDRGTASVSQLAAGEERLASAQRRLEQAQGRTSVASQQLATAQDRLRESTEEAAGAGERSGNRFARAWQGIRAKVGSAARDAVEDAGRQGAAAADDAGSKAGGAFAGGFKKAAGALAAVVALDRLRAGFMSAITEAGGLEQSVGAIETVFKGSSAQMLQWSRDASAAVGLSKNDYNELGTLIGTQLKNGGLAMDQLGPKTNQLIGLGADLSSMFGGTTKEAVEALSSALKGERDPIERYGVSLTQAAIDAKAAELGFAKVGGSFEAQAQQAATLALIMEQTADAQGNFARETDTFAHKQQVASTGWKNLSASIGELFLPSATAAMGFLGGSLLPMLQTLVGGVAAFGAAFAAGGNDITSSGFAGALEALGFKARAFVDGLATLGQAFSTMFGSLGPVFAPLIGQVVDLAGAFSPLGLMFRALAPVLPDLVGLLFQLGATIGSVLGQVLPPVTQIVQVLVEALSGVFVAILPTLVALVQTLGDAFTNLAPVIASLVAAVVPLVATLTAILAPIITELVNSVLPPVIAIIGLIVSAIAPLITTIAGILIPVIQALMPIVGTVFGAIAGIITAVMQIVQGVIEVATGIITGNWDQVWSGVLNIFRGIWNTIVAVVTGVLNTIGSVVLNGLTAVGQFVLGALGAIGRWFADAWDSQIRAVSGFIGTLLGFFGDLPGKIVGFLSGLGRSLWDIGRNMIQGLLDGAGSLLANIGNFFLNIVPDFIREPFKAALGIHSPSRVFIGYGEDIAEGPAIGVRRKEQGVRDATRRLAEAAQAGWATPTLGTALAGRPAAPDTGAGSAAGDINVYGNVYGDPEDIVDELNVQKSRAVRVNGLRRVAAGV